MKVILAPIVTVVGHSTFVEHPQYLIPNDGSDACKIGSFAAKGCYDSYGENGRGNQKNQESIIESKHGSILEHSTVSLFIEGVTRALTLEMNRHRLLAISQRSTRYTAEEDGSIVLDPYYAELFKKYDFRWEKNVQYAATGGLWMAGNQSVMEAILNRYTLENQEAREFHLMSSFLMQAESDIATYKDQVETLIKLNPMKLTGFDLRKWARGKARNVLPHCLETRVTYTANHRAWRWFVEARSSIHAEAEIRRLAHHVLVELRKIAPEYYDDFEQTQIYDGIPEWKPQYSKV